MDKILEVELTDDSLDEAITFSVGSKDVVVYVGIEEIRMSRDRAVEFFSKLNQAMKDTKE